MSKKKDDETTKDPLADCPRLDEMPFLSAIDQLWFSQCSKVTVGQYYKNWLKNVSNTERKQMYDKVKFFIRNRQKNLHRGAKNDEEET